MASNYISALVLGVVAALANVAGGLAITRRMWPRKHLRYFVAIGAGFMLGATLLEMVPESWKLNPQRAPFLLLGGYLLVHLVEHTVVRHFHFGEETHDVGGGHLGVSVMVGLGVHTFFDGVAIGSGFLVSAWLGWVLFLAVFAHKIPEGFTMASVMLAGGGSKRSAIAAAAAIGAASVAGVGVMLLFPLGLTAALPVAAGVTLYVAASDLVPEVNGEPGTAMAVCVFLGVAVLAALQALFQGV